MMWDKLFEKIQKGKYKKPEDLKKMFEYLSYESRRS